VTAPTTTSSRQCSRLCAPRAA